MLTFVDLYLYKNSREGNKRDKRTKIKVERKVRMAKRNNPTQMPNIVVTATRLSVSPPSYHPLSVYLSIHVYLHWHLIKIAQLYLTKL